MILADTSVWIDHFRTANSALQNGLAAGQIAIHPWIVAELALGSLRQRTSTLALLDSLPHVQVAQMDEVRAMIEARRLYSLGIGLADAQLIASVLISSLTFLWTKDARLRKVAQTLGIHATLP